MKLFLKATFLLILGFLTTCSDPNLDELGNPDVPWKQLENPYSIETMKQAWENIKPRLVANGKVNGDIEILTTNLYVKFMPKDSVELDRLIKEEALELYNYPLDVELDLPDESYYRDPAVPKDQPTYQYTVVKSNYKFPADIEYEILSELFLPDEEGYTSNGRRYRALSSCIQQELVNEAMGITRNFDEIVPVDCGGGGSGGYGGGSGGSGGGSSATCSRCPQGQILVENPISGTITRNGKRYDGVPEVKARARKWFKIKTAETNENGEFVINHVFGGNRKVNYGIKYTNKHALIRPVGIGFGPAFLDGPKQSGRWEYRSHRGIRSYLWGTIMRGVYDYHHIWAPQLNIGTPPDNIKIRACANNDCGVTTMLHSATTVPTGGFGRWLFSDIRIGSKDANYREIYATTIHELGHAAHWKLAGDWVVTRVWKIAFSHKLVREGWASGLTDHIYPKKFPTLGNYYQGNCATNARLRVPRMLDDGYPRILIRDLLDDNNEYDPNNPNCDDLYDEVKFVTLSDIFYALEDVNAGNTNSAMNKWRDNIINTNVSQRLELINYFTGWEK